MAQRLDLEVGDGLARDVRHRHAEQQRVDVVADDDVLPELGRPLGVVGVEVQRVVVHRQQAEEVVVVLRDRLAGPVPVDRTDLELLVAASELHCPLLVESDHPAPLGRAAPSLPEHAAYAHGRMPCACSRLPARPASLGDDRRGRSSRRARARCCRSRRGRGRRAGSRRRRDAAARPGSWRRAGPRSTCRARRPAASPRPRPKASSERRHADREPVAVGVRDDLRDALVGHPSRQQRHDRGRRHGERRDGEPARRRARAAKPMTSGGGGRRGHGAELERSARPGRARPSRGRPRRRRRRPRVPLA